jgi:DNA invertase Pin-like site-specific DNA recombinase
MKAAIYARVSTLDQEPENQLQELRRYVVARGWTATEYVDRGVSGAKDRRPALDRLVSDARRRRFDVIACWRLDRNLRHLVTLGDELQALGVGLVSLGESIDTTTPSGRLLFGILATLAAFERDRLRERTISGLQRAKAQGVKLGRRRTTPATIVVPGGSVRAAAAVWGVSKSTAARWISSGHVPATAGQTSETAA